jgi:undecaprenyl-diphosphatase
MGAPDQGLAYDIVAHFGTLSAVVAYFRSDISHIASGWWRHLTTRERNLQGDLGWAVLFGTIPVGLAGLLAYDLVARTLREPLVIAVATISFGALLWVADAFGRRQRQLDTLGWRDVIVVGAAQALALIPGTSRSGITLTAGLALGLTRTAAARFSFLLSIPVIAIATGHEAWSLRTTPVAIPWIDLLVVYVGSAISAFVCVAVFLSLIERVGLWPFVVYRFALGLILLWVFM